MYGVFVIKYGKGYLVQQFKTTDEAKAKCEELEAASENGEKYFVQKC